MFGEHGVPPTIGERGASAPCGSECLSNRQNTEWNNQEPDGSRSPGGGLDATGADGRLVFGFAVRPKYFFGHRAVLVEVHHLVFHAQFRRLKSFRECPFARGELVVPVIRVPQ